MPAFENINIDVLGRYPKILHQFLLDFRLLREGLAPIHSCPRHLRVIICIQITVFPLIPREATLDIRHVFRNPRRRIAARDRGSEAHEIGVAVLVLQQLCLADCQQLVLG